MKKYWINSLTLIFMLLSQQSFGVTFINQTDETIKIIIEKPCAKNPQSTCTLTAWVYAVELGERRPLSIPVDEPENWTIEICDVRNSNCDHKLYSSDIVTSECGEWVIFPDKVVGCQK